MHILRGETGCKFDSKIPILNPKGDVRHIYKSNSGERVPFSEFYFSEIYPHTIKGWKIHSKQTQNFSVAYGEIEILCIKKDNNKLLYQKYMLNSSTLYGIITIPPNLYYLLINNTNEKAVIFNAIDLPHDPEEGKTLPLNFSEFSELMSKLGYKNEI